MPQSHPILTLTLNPTLDMSTDAGHIRPNDKIRCDAPTLDPGGGGTNVARAIHALGGHASALVALAGFRGQQVAELLTQEGIPHVSFDLPGETRLSLAVGDRASGGQYRFVMPGPVWTEENTLQCLELIGAQISPGTLVVLSGSMPPGVTPDVVGKLASLTLARKGRLIIDTSGPSLSAAATAPTQAALLRLDQVESEALAGRPLPSAGDAAGFARRLIASGAAENVVLGRGADGSVLVTKTHGWLASGPQVPVRSKVGAGDSFLGAFTYAMARDLPPEQALCHGVAAASAAVMSAATSLCARADVEALVPQISLAAL